MESGSVSISKISIDIKDLAVFPSLSFTQRTALTSEGFALYTTLSVQREGTLMFAVSLYKLLNLMYCK